MKKVLITQRLDNDTYKEVRECLDLQYSKLISSIGFLPVILPHEVAFEHYFNNMQIDGVMLTGGNDLYCCNPNELSHKRDHFELNLLKHCISNEIPVLGICRGMQIIAKYFGSNFKKIEHQVNIKHKINVNNNSQFEIYLNNINFVNSFHNFSIDKLGDDLIVSATSEDNIIKAIEHKKYKIFAQMWHSERVIPFNINELNLIRGFFND